MASGKRSEAVAHINDVVGNREVKPELLKRFGDAIGGEGFGKELLKQRSSNGSLTLDTDPVTGNYQVVDSS